MFVDPKLAARARANLRLVRRTISQGYAEAIRYEVGLKYASFTAHGETDRADLAREFLEGVGGSSICLKAISRLKFERIGCAADLA